MINPDERRLQDVPGDSLKTARVNPPLRLSAQMVELSLLHGTASGATEEEGSQIAPVHDGESEPTKRDSGQTCTSEIRDHIVNPIASPWVRLGIVGLALAILVVYVFH
jgi:hypothetical protein